MKTSRYALPRMAAIGLLAVCATYAPWIRAEGSGYHQSADQAWAACRMEGPQGSGNERWGLLRPCDFHDESGDPIFE